MARPVKGDVKGDDKDADQDDDKAGDDKGGDGGPDVTELKRMLGRAKAKPIQAAAGQGNMKDGGLGLLMLDLVTPGKALMQALKAKDPGASKLCFGTVTVDKDADPKMVKLTVNRRAPGLDRCLRKMLKGTGYTKVTIVTGGQ